MKSEPAMQLLMESWTHGLAAHLPQSDTNGADGWAPDHRVWFVCTNFFLAGSGMINVSGNGYMGTTSVVSTARGCGPGGGGGRIAVWRISDQTNTNGWTIQVNGGAGQGGSTDGAPGTVYWGELPCPRTVITMR